MRIDNAKLEAFAAFYNDLMLAPSGLSKLEREMIAVAVSSAEPLLLLPRRARRGRAAALRRSGARRVDGDELSRRRACAAAPRHARFRREAHGSAMRDRGGGPGGAARRPGSASATSGTSPRSRLLQHVEPHGLGGRYAARTRTITARRADVADGRADKQAPKIGRKAARKAACCTRR